jgi:hypothetical protein
LSHSTTVLFGLPGVRVARVEQDELGERVVHVETAPGTSASGCPGCGVVSTSAKEYPSTSPAGYPLWRKGNLGRLAQDPVALQGAQLRARVVHRGHR